MPGSYDFCVTRTTDTSSERFPARFKFGDLDPSREVARVLVVQRFSSGAYKSVGATDYDANYCPGQEIQELTVAASGEQLQNLMIAVGNGNVAGAAVVAADIVAGGTVAVVKTAGNVVSGVVKAVDNFLKKPFG